MEQLSVREYAERLGVVPTALYNRLQKDGVLPGVSVKKIGKTYIIEVPPPISEKKPKKDLAV